MENSNINYDYELKKSFCNIRIWKVLQNSAFENFYINFLDKNNEFDKEYFTKVINYINKLLEENSINVRYDSIEEYLETYSSAANDIISDEIHYSDSMEKLKEDLLLFAEKMFKNNENHSIDKDIKIYLSEFIKEEKIKLEKIKSDYINKKIDETKYLFTIKFFKLLEE